MFKLSMDRVQVDRELLGPVRFWAELLPLSYCRDLGLRELAMRRKDKEIKDRNLKDQAIIKSKMFLPPTHIIDNTHAMAPGAPGYMPDDTFTLSPYGVFEKDGFVDFKLAFAEHFGTHMDAPIHFAGPGHLTIDRIPPESLIGPAVVVDVRDKVAENQDYQLAVSDLKGWEDLYGQIPQNAIVIMFSGWQDRWDDPEAYRNVRDGIHHFPGFSKNAVQWLLENRNIIGIGLDTLCLDYGPSQNYPVHRLLLNADKWGVENLCNLDKIPPQGGFMVLGPMKHKDGSGGPTRVYTFFN